MHLAFLGFGLIAGSIARAIRSDAATRDWPLAAWSPSGDGPRRALADGVVDIAADTPEAALDGAELVVLAAPVTPCLELIDRLAGPLRSSLAEGAVVTDVASTKGAIMARADAARIRFVGGHPMAGLETSGYGAARADLFVDRPWVVVPGASSGPSDVARVTDLVAACSARAVHLDAATHDRAVAGVSHLPLIVAAALAESVAKGPAGGAGGLADDWATAVGLAAGGWRDSTRVARGDPGMGAAIAVTNAPALGDRLRDLRTVLDAWQAELDRADGPDEAVIRERLAAAREILESGR
jgi:prephenate dehydrogenase